MKQKILFQIIDFYHLKMKFIQIQNNMNQMMKKKKKEERRIKRKKKENEEDIKIKKKLMKKQKIILKVNFQKKNINIMKNYLINIKIK